MDHSVLPGLMAYRCPELEDKLIELRMVPGRDEARRLFDEVKKYLFLCELDRARQIPMFSRRIDEVWHQFVLFTETYAAFSARFFGGYFDHRPFTSAQAAAEATLIDFARFQAEYEPLFGPVSPAWRDELAVDVDSRLIRASYGKPVEVRAGDGGKAELVWHLEPPRILLRTDARAGQALQFMLDNDHFYVRELPGLPPADQIAVCRALVQTQVLRVAP